MEQKEILENILKDILPQGKEFFPVGKDESGHAKIEINWRVSNLKACMLVKIVTGIKRGGMKVKNSEYHGDIFVMCIA